MKALLTLGVVLAVILALVGCGGAGSPGADNLVAPEAAVTPAGVVSPAAIDSALVGTWMTVIVRKDGVGVSPREWEGWPWPSGAVRHLQQFKSDGAFISTWYNAAGTAVGTKNGTWTADASTHSALLTLTGDPAHYDFTYSVAGNVLTTKAHVVYEEAHWITVLAAKLVTLTGHDAALVKTWKTTAVTLNGVAKPISYLTGTTAYPTFVRQFLAGGTSQRYRVKDLRVLLPNLASQTWVSGGGVVNYGGGPRQASIYTIAAGVLNIWQLDPNGNTLKITMKPLGATGAHAAALVAKWHPVSTTENGGSISFKVAFNWPAGVDSMKFIFWADGTWMQQLYQGTTLKYANLFTWYTSGSSLFVTGPDGPWTFAYSATANSVTLDFHDIQGHPARWVLAKD